MSASDDEYDAIFGDIDLAALDAVRVPMSVPAPARAPPPAAQSIARQSVGNAVAGPSTARPQLRVPSVTRPVRSSIPLTSSSTQSQSTRAQRLTQLIANSQVQSPLPLSLAPRVQSQPSTPPKRPSSLEVWSVSPPTKRRQAPLSTLQNKDQNITSLFEGFEEELTCPICCDLLALAYLGNPCGHTFCATCGLQWVNAHKSKPTCPICRAKLSRSTPLISNLAADSTVSRLAKSMADAGNKEWQVDGARMKEWLTRCSKGRAAIAQRAKDAKGTTDARSRRSATVVINVDEEDGQWLVRDDAADDSDYQQSDDEGDIRALVNRAVRTRRARTGGP